jgi:hypothetical protein
MGPSSSGISLEYCGKKLDNFCIVGVSIASYSQGPRKHEDALEMEALHLFPVAHHMEALHLLPVAHQDISPGLGH